MKHPNIENIKKFVKELRELQLKHSCFLHNEDYYIDEQGGLCFNVEVCYLPPEKCPTSIKYTLNHEIEEYEMGAYIAKDHKGKVPEEAEEERDELEKDYPWGRWKKVKDDCGDVLQTRVVDSSCSLDGEIYVNKFDRGAQTVFE